MSTSEEQFYARTHLCRLCGDPAERITDLRSFYSGRETATAYRGCLCGQYVLEHTALLAVDTQFNLGHPARRWMSMWIQQTHMNLADPWPVVTLSMVELAGREVGKHKPAGAGASPVEPMQLK